PMARIRFTTTTGSTYLLDLALMQLLRLPAGGTPDPPFPVLEVARLAKGLTAKIRVAAPHPEDGDMWLRTTPVTDLVENPDNWDWVLPPEIPTQDTTAAQRNRERRLQVMRLAETAATAIAGEDAVPVRVLYWGETLTVIFPLPAALGDPVPLLERHFEPLTEQADLFWHQRCVDARGAVRYAFGFPE
ncbi:hypothetical protein, partial [Arthrobacter sp. KK5.5]|uniref:hypothetical protein n=1 Tax=Arthrobacter sp. KK5.5 TaxID=3373084 RepID=UPI003EE73366